MYERGEYVVYRRTEVCRVADVAGLRDAGGGLRILSPAPAEL